MLDNSRPMLIACRARDAIYANDAECKLRHNLIIIDLIHRHEPCNGAVRLHHKLNWKKVIMTLETEFIKLKESSCYSTLIVINMPERIVNTTWGLACEICHAFVMVCCWCLVKWGLNCAQGTMPTSVEPKVTSCNEFARLEEPTAHALCLFKIAYRSKKGHLGVGRQCYTMPTIKPTMRKC